jgi:radical SAM protein with 4Fe4S-binding SPASM domain
MYTKNFRSITNGNRVVLANRDTGEWIRISKECFDILNLATEKRFSEVNLLSSFAEPEDEEYFRELLNKLKDTGIIAEEFNENGKIETVYLILTNRCNLRCKHCCVTAESINDSIGKNEMDTTGFKKVIDKVIKSSPDRVILSGGEPMIRKDFITLLKYLRSRYNGKISLSTNAILIDEFNVNEIVQNIDKIDISIDGIDEETCSIVRGKGIFEKVIKAIGLLKAKNFNEIYLSMVFGDFNQGLEDKFKELNKQLETHSVIRGFVPVGRGKDNESLFINKSNKSVFAFKYTDEEIVEAKKGTFCIRCGAGITEFVVNYDGKVYPCANLIKECYELFDIQKIHNLNEFFERDIVKESGYKAIKELQPENYKKCRECKVNLFCWTCLQDIEMLKENPDKFDKRCKMKQTILYPIIWG